MDRVSDPCKHENRKFQLHVLGSSQEAVHLPHLDSSALQYLPPFPQGALSWLGEAEGGRRERSCPDGEENWSFWARWTKGRPSETERQLHLEDESAGVERLFRRGA